MNILRFALWTNVAITRFFVRLGWNTDAVILYSPSSYLQLLDAYDT